MSNEELKDIKSKVEILLNQITSLNDKLEGMIQKPPLYYLNRYNYVILNMTNLEKITKEEVLLLNSFVTEKYKGTTVKSEEAIKQPTFEECEILYENQKDKGYNEAVCHIAIDLVREAIYQYKMLESSKNEISGTEA